MSARGTPAAPAEDFGRLRPAAFDLPEEPH
jgi:hypothetical protein